MSIFNNHMDLSKESRNAFEIIASYYIDQVYNKLYDHAVLRHKKSEKNNLYECYTIVLNHYIGFHKDKQSYTRTINELYNKYKGFTRKTITFLEFINVMSKEFIPEDYYLETDSNARAVILNKIINDTIGNFIHIMIKDKMVYNVLNNRPNKDSARELQNNFIICLLNQRKNMYDKFLSPPTKQSDLDSNATIKKMSELYSLCENYKKHTDKLNKKLDLSITLIEKCKNTISNKNDIIANLQKQNTKLLSIIESIKQQPQPMQPIQSMQQPMQLMQQPQPQLWNIPQPISQQPLPMQQPIPQQQKVKEYNYDDDKVNDDQSSLSLSSNDDKDDDDDDDNNYDNDNNYGDNININDSNNNSFSTSYSSSHNNEQEQNDNISLNSILDFNDD